MIPQPVPRSYTRWSPERVAELYRLWCVERQSRFRIALVLGCTSAAVRSRVRRYGWQRPAAAQTQNLGRVWVRRKRVRCLPATHCGGWFFSPDPRRVRVCPRCRPAWLERAGCA